MRICLLIAIMFLLLLSFGVRAESGGTLPENGDCMRCHQVEARYFSQSPHKKIFEEMGVPPCLFCHGDHTRQSAVERLLMKGPEPRPSVSSEVNSVCMKCHASGDGTKGSALAQEFFQAISRVRQKEIAAISSWRQTLEFQNSQEEFPYVFKQLGTSLKEIHKATHSVRTSIVTPMVDAAVMRAEDLERRYQRELKILFFKRIVWFLGIGALFCALMIPINIRQKR